MTRRVLVIGASGNSARLAALIAMSAKVECVAITPKPIINDGPPEYAKPTNEKPWGKRNRNKPGGIRTK